MKCELCQKEIHDKYGTGRFCSSHCARKYSTSKDRISISEKTSSTLKEKFARGEIKLPKFIPDPKNAAKIRKEKSLQDILTSDWSILSLSRKRRRIDYDQNGKCLICGISEWNGNPITLHLDHVDGDNRNEERSNLRLICPNCHSQTSTYCGKKSNQRLDDDSLKRILIHNNLDIQLALKEAKRRFSSYNLKRCKKLVEELSSSNVDKI